MGRHLIAMGHKRIGVMSSRENNMHTKKRLMGFQRALFEAGIPYNPDWTIHGDWKKETGYRLAPEVLKMNPTVNWCMNDQMAGGVYKYLYEHGLEVGKDISVAGYDNMEEGSYMLPRLTTNELPLKEIGRKSAETLIQMIENEGWRPDEMKTWISCTMIYGDSVKKI